MTISKNKVARFEFEYIPRSTIKEAAYNPRAIDEATEQRLREGLVDPNVGLVEALVYNKRTGTLVGGHQRLKQMDIIHADVGDYEVPVAVIDVDEQTEKRINLILNNPGVSGEWDVMKLEALFQNVDPFTSGFDVLDLREMFDGDSVLSFIDRYYPEAATADGELPGATDKAHLADTEAEIAKIKDARKSHKEADRESLRSDHILVVVFETPTAATNAMKLLHINPGETFIFADKAFAAFKEHAGEVYSMLTVTKPTL